MVKKDKYQQQHVTALTVRVPQAIVSDIDSELQTRAVRVPRNTWILEAVVEKLDRERSHGVTNVAREVDDGQE